MDTAYHFQAVPVPVRCLGTRLQPFTLGHQLLLERFNSPFVTGGPAPFAELIFAVAVCSRPYAEAVAWLHSRRAPWQMWLWGKRILLAVSAGHDLIKSHQTFCRYLEDGSRGPHVNFEPGDTKECGAPLVAMIKWHLQKHGATETEALNKPWGQALWDYAIGFTDGNHNEIVSEARFREVEELSKPLSPEEMEKLVAAHSRNN